jgi:hypothetical protein
VEERRRAERQLEDVMEQLEPRGVPEPHAELGEPAARQPIAIRQAHVLVVEAPADIARTVPVIRVAGIEALERRLGLPVCRGVDVVSGPPDGCQPTGDQGLAEALRRERQVGQRREAAEALAEHGPRR